MKEIKMKFSRMSEEDQKKILVAVQAEVFMQNYLPIKHFFYVKPIIKAFEEVMEKFEKKYEEEERMSLHRTSLATKEIRTEIFFPDKPGKHSRRFPYGR